MSLAFRDSTPLLRTYCAPFGLLKTLRYLPPHAKFQYSHLEPLFHHSVRIKTESYAMYPMLLSQKVRNLEMLAYLLNLEAVDVPFIGISSICVE